MHEFQKYGYFINNYYNKILENKDASSPAVENEMSEERKFRLNIS